MSFERTPFGDGTASATPDNNVLQDVSNHYGPRFTGGEQGRVKTEGAEHQSAFDFNGDGPLFDEQFVPANAIVTDVRGYNLTGAVATATVGAQSVIAARDDDDATWVTITDSAVLDVTGPTEGVVIVKWRYIRSQYSGNLSE